MRDGGASRNQGRATEQDKPITIIANPISGGGRSYRKARELESRLNRLGIICRVITTDRAGHGRELAHRMARESRVVVAVGGDGTVNEVAHGLAGTETPLVVLPTGTANVLAHELGIRKHVGSAVKAIVRGRRRHMDLGRVTQPGEEAGGRTRFVCMASCGFDAEVVRTMALRRTGSISYGHYIPVMARALCDYDYPRLSVILNGHAWPRKVCHVVISNTRSYGGPFRVATRARYDDRMFDVVMFEYPGPWWLLAYMGSLVIRAQRLLPGVRMVRARKVQVECESPAPYQLDGDFAGYAPLTVEVEPRALSVLTAHPRGKDDDKNVQD